MMAYTVSEITRYIKSLIDGDGALSDLTVEGEVSNCRRASSGHCYFTLRDSDAELKCVMWRTAALRMDLPEQGERVRARGYISVYERGGAYQFYVHEMVPIGDGLLWQQFLALKARLESEGLFDPASKRPLPAWPRRIGVVTSPSAAAFQDICNVLAARYPLAEVVLSPSLVQGQAAPESLVAALQAVGREPGVDVVIVARGGGSIEDLWAFNDEHLARAVRACPVPVVSGVGHETDFTIIDFCADLRAPTPSAAAAAVVPDVAELAAGLEAMVADLEAAMQAYLGGLRERLALQERLLAQRSPQRRLAELLQRVDDLTRRLHTAMAHRQRLLRLRAEGVVARLQALSPTTVLARGYAIVQDGDTGRVLSSARDTAPGRNVRVRLQEGGLDALVTRVHERGQNTDGR